MSRPTVDVGWRCSPGARLHSSARLGTAGRAGRRLVDATESWFPAANAEHYVRETRIADLDDDGAADLVVGVFLRQSIRWNLRNVRIDTPRIARLGRRYDVWLRGRGGGTADIPFLFLSSQQIEPRISTPFGEFGLDPTTSLPVTVRVPTPDEAQPSTLGVTTFTIPTDLALLGTELNWQALGSTSTQRAARFSGVVSDRIGR